MAEESKMETRSGVAVQRIFEQPADAQTCYADFAQIVATGAEVILQFYETIPGTPGVGGKVTMARSRLRSTVITSPQHAANIARLILERVQPETSGASASGASE